MSEVIVCSSKNNGSPECYHTEECVAVRRMRRTIYISEEQASKRGLQECGHCAGRQYVSKRTPPDNSYYRAALKAGDTNE